MKIEFKEFNIKDLNAIIEIVNTLSFDNGEYSPANQDFFSKAYVYFLTSNIVDKYISKNKEDSVVINDFNGLFEFIYSKEMSDIISNYDCNEYCERFNDITQYCFNMIEKKIEYTKQMNILRKYPLTDVSLSDLIDTINHVVESFENSITSEDVRKLIESKDDIVSALTDRDRLNKDLAEYEKRKKRITENIKSIDENFDTRSDKSE